MWAIAQCTLLVWDLGFDAFQVANAGVVAYGMQTGNVKWKTLAIGNVGYIGLVLLYVGHEKQVVTIGAS